MPLYAGLMSGTSMDGIEAVLLAITDGRLVVRASHHHDYPRDLALALEGAVTRPENLTADQLGELDVRVGEAFADAVQALLEGSRTPAGTVRAIGSHGQTVLHRPRAASPFTMQIGDPNVIAERCGIDVVADFRRRDMAAGGEGPPLLPAFHALVFGRADADVAVVNIGGIANVTLLGADGSVRGFDTGPGNCLMDLWARRTLGTPYDRDGHLAAGGRVDEALLDALLAEPYLARPFPKSTGRELFNSPWLEAQLGTSRPSPEDVQATLCEYTARTIAEAIVTLARLTPRELHVCGGGALNPVLMGRLAAHLPSTVVKDTGALGIRPDVVEAAGLAWFAHLRLERRAGNLPAVTGARGPRVLGAVYCAAMRL